MSEKGEVGNDTGVRRWTRLTGATITPGTAGRRTAAVLDCQLTSNDPDTASIIGVLRVTSTQLCRCPFTHAHARSQG